VTLALVLGGVYLAYEGFEKVYHFFLPHKHKKVKKEHAITDVILSKEEQLIAEKAKIKSAIFTDFILSVEIVIIALGTVIGKPILFQVLVVSIIAVIATVGVYGMVALIVRMDDFGLKLVLLNDNKKSMSHIIGNLLINTLPWVIKSLSVVGTIALLLVAGGIFSHNIEFFHHILENIPSTIKDLIIGLMVGLVAFLVVTLFKRIFKLLKKNDKI